MKRVIVNNTIYALLLQEALGDEIPDEYKEFLKSKGQGDYLNKDTYAHNSKIPNINTRININGIERFYDILFPVEFNESEKPISLERYYGRYKYNLDEKLDEQFFSNNRYFTKPINGGINLMRLMRHFHDPSVSSNWDVLVQKPSFFIPQDVYNLNFQNVEYNKKTNTTVALPKFLGILSKNKDISNNVDLNEVLNNKDFVNYVKYIKYPEKFEQEVYSKYVMNAEENRKNKLNRIENHKEKFKTAGVYLKITDSAKEILAMGNFSKFGSCQSMHDRQDMNRQLLSNVFDRNMKVLYVYIPVEYTDCTGVKHDFTPIARCVVRVLKDGTIGLDRLYRVSTALDVKEEIINALREKNVDARWLMPHETSKYEYEIDTDYDDLGKPYMDTITNIKHKNKA